MDIEICLMSEEDHMQVLSLYERVFNKKQKNDYHISDSNAIFVVAKTEGKVIGLVQLDIITDVFKGIKYGYINSVCTDFNYRNMGVGDKMIKECTKIAINNNCNYIELTSSDSKVIAHKLYYKNGYVIRKTNVFRKELK